MKKIMFNDKYGLTKAVLDGRKTQTRRIITCPNTFRGQHVAGFHVYKRKSDGLISEICMYDEDEIDFDEGQLLPIYKEGEIVAVAQSYKDAGYKCYAYWDTDEFLYFMKDGEDVAIPPIAETNKMYVKPIYMPHQIKITNVRIERLQDISDDDCLKEGVVISEPKIKGGVRMYDPCEYLKSCANKIGWGRVYHTPREAYAALIDKVGKKGDWDKNPYVFVYDFELVK